MRLIVKEDVGPHHNMKAGNDEMFRRVNPGGPLRHEPETDLAEKIRKLQADRQQHAQAIEEIDQVLGRVENALAALKAITSRSGRGSAKNADITAPGERPRRHYQKFELTGEESVLDFVRRQGHPTTAEINANWQGEGRTGVANPILARL